MNKILNQKDRKYVEEYAEEWKKVLKLEDIRESAKEILSNDIPQPHETDVNQIEIDLHRTFIMRFPQIQENHSEAQNDLRKVLYTFVYLKSEDFKIQKISKLQEIHYGQGMNFFAAFFLICFQNKTDAALALYAFSKRLGEDEDWNPNDSMKNVKRLLEEEKLGNSGKEIYEVFERMNISQPIQETTEIMKQSCQESLLFISDTFLKGYSSLWWCSTDVKFMSLVVFMNMAIVSQEFFIDSIEKNYIKFFQSNPLCQMMLNVGWTPEEAFGIKVQGNLFKQVEKEMNDFMNVVYANLKEIAIEYVENLYERSLRTVAKHKYAQYSYNELMEYAKSKQAIRTNLFLHEMDPDNFSYVNSKENLKCRLERFLLKHNKEIE